MDLLAHLEAYVAAVDEASFSRAADRLGIAQPLLSRRIKTLEEYYGGLLFDRSRRQVTITEFGVILLPYAQDVLDRAQRLRQIAVRAGAEYGTPLAVRDLPPDERESGLAEGSLAYALMRVAPEDAALRVHLGLASAPPSDTPDDVSAGPTRTRIHPRAVHLEDLRPPARPRRTERAADPHHGGGPGPPRSGPAETDGRPLRAAGRSGPPGRSDRGCAGGDARRPGDAAVHRAVRAAARGALGAARRHLAAPGVAGPRGAPRQPPPSAGHPPHPPRHHSDRPRRRRNTGRRAG
ncbi:LysR family transcriptional regulator [Streptomyces sp. NPDC002758]